MKQRLLTIQPHKPYIAVTATLAFYQTELILQYFSYLSTIQQTQFRQIGAIYQEWNSRINLISRKDMGNLYLKHVLYSLSIAKIVAFKPNATILDVGTGGGFPGIPLAILFPQVHFHLIDSVRKKVTAVQRIAQSLGLTNVTTQAVRAEALKGRYDFILGRAVTNLNTFYSWAKDKLASNSQHDMLNGILYLRGNEPINPTLNYHSYSISQFFNEPFFQTKQLVHVYP